MSVNLAQVVGHEFPDKAVSWNRRDLLLYAAGIGAKANDLNVVYELDKNFSAFPTFPVVLPFKLEEHDVNLFAERMKSPPVSGLPKLDPKRIVHASQSIEILKELPPASGLGWKWKSRYSGVVENKTGLLLTVEGVLVDPNGTPYAKLYSSTFYIGTKATGDRFSKVIAGPPQAKPTPKNKTPTYVVKDQTTPEQAIVYRLSGDYNPLHVDASIGKAIGFGGIILHGLSTFGFAARAIVNAVGGKDPNSLKLFGTRFTAPVKPGDALETQIWEVGPGPKGTVEVAFVMKNLSTGKDVLGGGMAYVVKPNAKL
ncbi:hypothetical protein AX15_000219 [Amanita polypyramis BW_CC]|nr:hypothetical protein AX15_000219 [Amanita polypyramis BW_CC]